MRHNGLALFDPFCTKTRDLDSTPLRGLPARPVADQQAKAMPARKDTSRKGSLNEKSNETHTVCDRKGEPWRSEAVGRGGALMKVDVAALVLTDRLMKPV